MPKKSTLVLLAAVAVLGFAAGCREVAEAPSMPVYKTGLKKEETKNSAFKEQFPAQYASYLKNSENEKDGLTEFGLSVPYMKNDNVNPLPEGYKNAQPYLKNLWLGYPFSFEYRKARGHTNAIADILHIDRINNYSEDAGLPATCWNCKTTKMPEWVGEHGDKFWSKNFHEFRQKVDVKDHAIGCATCHEPDTMALRITSVPLNDALLKMGKDWKTASRNEMRSLVCAQCHVEYYFQDAKFGAKAKPIFPWANGYDPDNMVEYYKDHGSTEAKGFEGNFVDWVQPVSNTPMIKAQHPEYEMWIDGTHGAAGVACADCHMAFTRSLDPDKKKVSGHQWRSPLLNADQACRQCHADKTADFLKERVLYTQKKVFDQLLKAQEASVKAHEAVRQANEFQGAKNPDFEKLVVEAKQNIRRGAFLWDFVSAENSMGFHNPAKALSVLARSKEASQNAVELATRATNYGIAASMDKPTKELVPPILKHSRELQMDPEHLKKHIWTKYLKPLPKAQRVWDGQTKLVSSAPAPAAPAAPAPAPAAPAPAPAPAAPEAPKS